MKKDIILSGVGGQGIPVSYTHLIIAIIVLIPILFGVYLYCQQINIQKNNEPQTDTSFRCV